MKKRKKKKNTIYFKGMFQVQNMLTFINSIWDRFFFLFVFWNPGYKNALRLEIKGDMYFKDLNAEKCGFHFC